MVSGKFVEQRMDPVQAEAASGVTPLGGVQSYVRLLCNQFPGIVGRPIVDHEKVIDPDASVMVENGRQPQRLITHDQEAEDQAFPAVPWHLRGSN
jgi:hypothetical protein